MEPKMKYLENTKKYTYNNDKGKSEIMRMELSKKKKGAKETAPVVTVKKGEIGYTDKYKYMGDQYDKTGRNIPKIEKKMEKRNFIIAEVRRMGNYKEVGAADTSVRMTLLEMVVKPTLLFNTETWVNVTNEEMKVINRNHYEVLKKVFEQGDHVPYYGILAETGYWPYSYVIIYKRLMFFHHLMHSDERRVARRIVRNQMNKEGEGGTNWYSSVKEWLDKLELENEVEELMEITKSSWKKVVKEKLGQVVEEEIMQKCEEMTKLRFISISSGHKTQEYVKTCKMEEVKSIMKMRLNMTKIRANFKGRENDLRCVACKLEDETTEHVIQCSEYKRLIGHSVEIESSVFQSMQSLEWVREACKVYERIEETKKWLA